MGEMKNVISVSNDLFYFRQFWQRERKKGKTFYYVQCTPQEKGK